MSDENTVKITPRIDHEIIPLESGGAIIFLKDFDMDVEDQYSPNSDVIDPSLRQRIFSRIKVREIEVWK